MKSKGKIPGMRAHLWWYFCTFAIVIMLILWVLQILFLNAFFNTMKLRELKKMGDRILAEYKLSDDFFNFRTEHSFNLGVFANIISEDGEVMEGYSYRRFDGADGKMHREDDFRVQMTERFIDSISKADSVSYIEKNPNDGAQFAVYGAYLGKIDGKKMYLRLSSPVERTDTTRRVLQSQLAVVTVISVLLASVLAYFIARRLSKPIEKITDSAQKLAKGDYGIAFESGTYREINELAQTLNRTSEELSKTEELRKDLISNISHDLRTPLTIIKSYAEMIRDISGSNEEKRNVHTGVIIDETNRLSLLVSDLLDLSKIQSGTVTMNKAPFDIGEAAGAILSAFKIYEEKHGYKFTAVFETTKCAIGDRRRIEQVIYNLIANAINYTGDDKQVFITAKDSGDKIYFSVRDTGVGIPQDEIDRVWDKYYKSAKTHTRQSVGTGIGLSIVKNILTAHGAAFGVKTSHHGSEFWFELPAEKKPH